MAIVYPSNIEYLGNKPNFTRDSFDTKASMDSAIELGYIDEGHLSYCKEDGKTYKATVKTYDKVSGTLQGGPLRYNILTGKLVSDESDSANGIYAASVSVQIKKGDTVNFTCSTSNCSVYTCDAFVVTGKVKKIKDISTIDTITFPETCYMFLTSETDDHNFSNDTYVLKHKDSLVWTDILGDLQEDLMGVILDDEKVVSEALYDLNGRLELIEEEFEEDESGSTRLDKVYEWFYAQTHIPVFDITIDKTSEGSLRVGTEHTYSVTFNWNWANMVYVTGIKTYNGSSWSSITELTEPATTDGSQNLEMSVTVGSSDKTIQGAFVTDSGNIYYSESLTVSPVFASRSFSRSGLPTTWTLFTASTTYNMVVTATGSNLPTTAVGESVTDSLGNTLGTIGTVTDSPWTVSKTTTITPGIPDGTIYYWNIPGSTSIQYKPNPRPSIIIVSSTKNAWSSKSLVDLASLLGNSGNTKYNVFMEGTVNTTSPEVEFTAGSTMIYLSPSDVRGMTVKSQASGSDVWTTITGFSESGTIQYNGMTYYYISNPNIGAGKFKFNFS